MLQEQEVAFKHSLVQTKGVSTLRDTMEAKNQIKFLNEVLAVPAYLWYAYNARLTEVALTT